VPVEGLSLIAQFNFQRAQGVAAQNPHPFQGKKRLRAEAILFSASQIVIEYATRLVRGAVAVNRFFVTTGGAFKKNGTENTSVQNARKYFLKFF